MALQLVIIGLVLLAVSFAFARTSEDVLEEQYGLRAQSVAEIPDRHSHPNPDRIGREVSTNPGRALAGISDWYVETGTLGPSVRGKVPIWATTGENAIGIVSISVLIGEVSEAVQSRMGGVLLVAGVCSFSALWRRTLHPA